MKKAVFAAVLSTLATLALSGCQTSGYMSSAAADGDGVTCDKIYQAFDAYQSDRQSAKAMTDLTRLINPTAGSMAERGVTSAEGYYEQVKASANIALAVRGCQPV